MKVFEYLKSNSLPNGFVALQEMTFKGKTLYSLGTKISCNVAIAFIGSKSLEVVETKNDDQGRILILDIKICDKELLPLKLYNANTEKKQLDTLTKLSEVLYSIPNIINENVILGGDLNFFFNASLETQGVSPVLKKHLTKRTFHQNGISGRIQRRLNYFLISNFLQETIIRAAVLVSFCSDHSPITFELNLN